MNRAWIVICALLIAPFSFAQEAPDAVGEETRIPALVQRALTAYEAEDYERMEQVLERAVELRPQLADLRFLLAKAYALQDEKQAAFNALVELQSQGLSFPLEGDPDFENLRPFDLYDYLVEQFAKNGQPYAPPASRFEIESTDLLLESIAYDPTGDRYLVGSIATGTVYLVSDDGDLTPFIEPNEDNGLLGIADLLVDAERGVLWVASGASPHVRHARASDLGASYVHRFDLQSGKPLARFRAATRASYFLDLALAPDGTVYAADSVNPVVWKTNPAVTGGQGNLSVFFGSNALTGIRAVAVDDRGEHVYFADYELGLFGVPVGSDQAFEVHLGQALNLSGIDQLLWYQDSLVAVQNGVSPRRVLRFQLFDDHRRGRHAQAMTSGQPYFRNPTAGTLVGDDLVIIANSHRNAYDPRSGKPTKDAELKPPKVVAIALDFGWMPPPERSGPEAAADG